MKRSPGSNIEAMRYLTATDVAALCEVELKTIHNWTDKNNLPHFTTPGNHLRFKPRELAPWMRQHGYDIPAALAKAEAADLARVAADAAEAA